MPDASLVATTDLCDLYADIPEVGLQIALPGLQPFGGRRCMCGPVATLSCSDDNVLLRELLGGPGEGRILVVDGHASTNRALLGDIQASRAKLNDWAGILIHGYVRDRLALAALPFPVFALGTVPLRPLKRRTGEAGGRLCFMNLRIQPGMWIYADEDGVVVTNYRADMTIQPPPE